MLRDSFGSPFSVRALALGMGLSALACAAPRTTYRTADHWSKEGYEWPPGSGADQVAHKSENAASPLPQSAKTYTPSPAAEDESADVAFVAPALPRVAPPEPTRAPLFEPRRCLRELKKLGVSFKPLRQLEGVESPVRVSGKLGGVTFWASDGRPLDMDCRLAVALETLRPVFEQHGLTRIRFSGAYAYRRTRSGRLSHHAHGLAIDLHDLEFGDTTLSVEDDFTRRAGCQSKNPILNRLVCSMRDQRLFEEFLTPDYDFDHRDHLHVSVPLKD